MSKIEDPCGNCTGILDHKRVFTVSADNHYCLDSHCELECKAWKKSMEGVDYRTLTQEEVEDWEY